jgi:protocatechuate 3,4-dioxygenase beta subunit
MHSRVSRRTALRVIAVGTGSAITPSRDVAAQTVPSEQPQGSCTLFPQAVEGPFYFDPKLERADITEGRPGAPVRLMLRVVDSAGCVPLGGARVDVWHADASGIYSGYAGQGDDRKTSAKGEHYLRGTQMTDVGGNVAFTTVFPGWYPGRTPHIHVKIWLDKASLVTGQVYFPDKISQRIYASEAAYRKRPNQDTTNATDGLFKQGMRSGGGIVLSVAPQTQGSPLVASLLITVGRDGSAGRRASSWGGWLRGLAGR